MAISPSEFIKKWSRVSLSERMLTKLYNARPAWLASAHAGLDAAVAAAYGWPDGLAPDDIIVRLLAHSS